jgi:micrococcal nuclease
MKEAAGRLLFCLLCCLFAPALACGPRLHTVSRVIDGDTILLAGGTRVRYIGMDTPESVHPNKRVEFMAEEAAEFNRGLVEGKKVRLEYDVERRDRYGRTLAYVYLDTLFVNAEMVKRGYAQILTIPPNVKYVDVFRSLQQEARENERGLWDEGAAARWRSGN